MVALYHSVRNKDGLSVYQEYLSEFGTCCVAGYAAPVEESILAHYDSHSASTTPAEKAALAAVLRPQDDVEGDWTPKKQRQRPRQESCASLMDTPPPRTLVKFPSQRPASRQSGIAQALSFWSPQQPDVLSLE
jgi:hypothetical protein